MTKKRPHAIAFDPDEGLTRQSFKDECDVSNIVRTYTETGMVNHIARQPPEYGDAPEGDFLELASIQAQLRSIAEERGVTVAQLIEETETPDLEPEPEDSENVPPEASQEALEAPEIPPKDGA